jgi:alpha-mannosidase
MIANAHIDPVWLWPWQAGADEALATAASMADRCDEYPDFVFTRGEAWLYAQAERIRPDLFARICAAIERGQWHVTGGQFIQPDLNLPTATGLHRQIEHGQRYFRDRFGIAPDIGYNVDSFGHTATLPDILSRHGYRAYVFRRPEQHQTALPANVFRWQGTGGAQLTAFRIEPGYVANFADLAGQVRIAVESVDEALGHTMCFYGVGNHGGGPSKAMIEWILANPAFDGHELVFSTPAAFFDAIAPHQNRLPVVTTELQHCFPGCYSVMHDIKSAQRHGENLLTQAEAAARALAADAPERDAALARLDAAWDDLLLTEFHDILTGTSIPGAWDGVRAMQGRARITGEEVLYDLTRRWSYRTLPRVDAHQVVVLNTADRPRRTFVEAEPYLDFDDWHDRWIADETGAPVSFQEVQPDSNQLIPRILFAADLPAAGARQFQVRVDPRPAAPPDEQPPTASPHALSNGRVTVALNATGLGAVTVDGRDVLKGLGLQLRKDTTDTWTFHTDRWDEPVEAALDHAVWEVEETGPLRVRARLDAHLRHSHIRLSVALYRGEPALHLDLRVTFDARYTLLQMPIELAAPPGRWTDGLADGAVDRTPSPTEWPFLGWSRLRVGDTDVGLTTSDVYSHSVDAAHWTPTLLRSPRMAWGGGNPRTYAGRDQHTDQGTHRFALTLHFADTLDDAAMAAALADAAHPLVVFDRYEGMDRPAWGPVPPRGLWGPAMLRNVADARLADPGQDAPGGLFNRPGHDPAG